MKKPSNNRTIDEKYNSAFADRLRDLLGNDKKAVKKLAEKLGVSQQQVSNYKNGINMPSISMLCAIADYFQCSTDYLLGVSDTKSPKTNIQAIRNETGLSEEAICSLQREMQIMKRLTNRNKTDDALSEFLAFRKFSHFVSPYNGQVQLADYAKKHGFVDIDEILDYELNLTPIKLLQFVPDVVILNELMLGSASKYTNTELRTFKNALYGVLNFDSTDDATYYVDNSNYVDYVNEQFFENIEEEINPPTEEDWKYVLDNLTGDEAEQFKEEPKIDPVIEELHKANAFDCNGLSNEDMFAFKLLRLQQALTARLAHIKKSTNGSGIK